ncbi:MAG: hypothetical protein JSW42_04445 [Chloroflexota bacterium]|nr:MAG: hypothetical protein JSW42_04445 [Chloroflexota bacterium]
MQVKRWSKIILIVVVFSFLLAFSNYPPGDELQRIRSFSRDREFDFVGWILDAFGTKFSQAALAATGTTSPEEQRQLVLDYIELIDRINQLERHLNDIYADPEVVNPESASNQVRQQLADLEAERDRLGPIAESILQAQISEVVADLGLTVGGQPLPPVLYHSTPLPTALIVSPRDEIIQQHHISLEPDINVDERAILEDRVDKALDVSSLVVNVGGIGVYPTMVLETSNLNFLTEVVAHEWIHNFLSLRPLGLKYFSSPELRTMNETAAAIAGREIGRAVIERFYPELLPPPPPPEEEIEPGEPPPPPAFDFREEMRETRVTADRLLAEGDITGAEEYMEERRQVFWENGYRLRKINQAYFAFYGAYADEPGGAAGEDPVGEAVRRLFAESPSLASFLKRIAWMTSFEELLETTSPNAD